VMVNLGLIHTANGKPGIRKEQMKKGLVTLLARLTGACLESTCRTLKQLRLESV
jgi:hypothetical protein